MFEQIIDKIEKYDSIVLFGHLNPDGDCYGSQIALRAILKEHYPNKQVFAVGSGLPKFFHLLGKMDQVSDEIIKNSLAVVLDSNDLNRVEDRRVFSALDFVKIDHHIDNHSFHEGPEVISTEVTSTSELICLLARENNYVIPLIAAKALYLGIFTDSSRFQYATNYIQLFDILKELINLGVKPIELTAILNIVTEKNLEIKSFIYRNIQKDPGGIVYVVASNEDRRSLGITSTPVTANTSLISHIDGYPVWFIASETDNGGMQVEMRSNLINVHRIARIFSGGGHTFAAGFFVDKFSQENIEKILDILRNAIKEKEA